MKNIWLLTITSMKRNKLFLSLSVFGGLLLCFLLIAMGNLAADLTLSKIKIGVIDQDQSVLSGDFKGYLAEELNYELVENQPYEELSTELIDKQISVIIEIPEGFYDNIASGNMQDVTITALDDYENSAFLEAYLNSYLGSIRLLSDSAAGDKAVFDQLLADYDKEEIKITQSAAQGIDKKLLKEKEGFNNSIGFFLMIIFGLSIVISFIVLEDRLSGVFSRIKITPVKPVQYIIGTGIFGLVLCLLEVLIYCGFIRIAGYNIGFNLWLLVFMMVLFSLFTICFAIAIALSLKSKSALAAASMGFSTIGCILGGAYFPLDLAPKSLQNLAKILPQYWFMDTFRTVQADPAANIAPNIMILILFTLLTFLIGAVLFSQNYKSN
jgi:ABC-2 type transport system permease protein